MSSGLTLRGQAGVERGIMYMHMHVCACQHLSSTIVNGIGRILYFIFDAVQDWGLM